MTTDYTIDDGYIELPVTVNPSTIVENALSSIATTLPGWVPRESHIEVLLLEQMAQMVSVSATVAAQVPEAIFSVFGSLVGITPIQGQAATAQTQWTMADAQGYTVSAGTVLAYSFLGNETYLFSTVSQFTVSPGYTTTAHDYPAGILIQAQNIGVAYNGLPLAPPAPQGLTLVTSLSFVSSIGFLGGGTSGGVDPETTAAYLDRLSNELHYLAPRPILPGDFAGLSTNVAGVYRAAAFNGLNPYGNILTALEALFNSSVTWTVVAGSTCTLSPYTGGTAPHAMRITGNGSGNAQAITAHNSFPSQPPSGYSVSPGQAYVAMVMLQNASAAKQVQVRVNAFDVGGYSTGTFTSTGAANATDLTSKNTIFWVPLVVPAETFTANLEVIVNGVVNAETHDVFAAGIMQAVQPTNLVPDSSFLQVNSPTAAVNPGALTWTLSNGALSVGPFLTEINALIYTAVDGSAHTYTGTSTATYLAAGTYTIAAYVDASNVTSVATPAITVFDCTTSANLTVTWATAIANGVAGLVYGTFVVPTGGGMIQTVFSTNAITVPATDTVTFAEPQVLVGNVVPTLAGYTPGITFTQPGQIYSQERTVTVAAVDVSGNALSATVANNLSNYLESQREVNFIVNVISPTYTSIDVTWTATCYSTYNAVDVEAAIVQAINNYLNPQTWASGGYTAPYWDPTQNSVWYLSIVTLIGEVPGVQHLETVGIRYTPASSSENVAFVTSDLPLPGYAPMPTAGTVQGTVTSS